MHQALLARLKENRLQFAREGNGTLVEAMVVDQVLITWLELYFYEVKELTHPASNLQYHQYRARRIEQLSTRHLRSLQLLARIRTNKTETVQVENIVVNSTTLKQSRKRRRSQGTPVNRIAQLVDGLDPVLQN